MDRKGPYRIESEWLRQYQERTGTAESDSPALRNAYRQHLFRQRQKAAPLPNASAADPLRNAPRELTEAAKAEVEAILRGLSKPKREMIQWAFEEEVEQAVWIERLAIARTVEERLEALTPDEQVERLPPGPETVSALLDGLSPADLEALRNARELTAADIAEFERIFAPKALRNGREG